MQSDFAFVETFLARQPALPPDPAIEAVLQPLRDLRPVLNRPLAQVTFFGAFKAGKSTLLNAIIGSPLLPSRTNRATGVITRLAYGSTLAAWVVRDDPPAGLRREPIFFDDLARYVLLDVSGPTARALPNILEVQLSVPLPLLEARCRLADTPGLLDNAELTARTWAELGRTDLAVLILSADKLVSEAERLAARRVQAMTGGNLVFVVNRLDLVDEDDRQEVLEWAASAFAELGNELVGMPLVFATEAKGALDSRKKNRAPTADGLLEFENWLQNLLDGPQGSSLIRRARLSLLANVLVNLTASLIGLLTTESEILTHLEADARHEQTRRQREARQGQNQQHQRLTNLKNGLPDLTARFVQATLDLARVRLNTQPTTDLERVLQTALDDYVIQVYGDVERILSNITLHIPKFGLSPYRVDTRLDPPITSGGWLDDPLSRVAETVGRMNNRVQPLARLEQTLTRLQPILQDEAATYLGRLDDWLAQNTPPSASITASPALINARQKVAQLQKLTDWSQQFETTVRQALSPRS